MVTVVLAVVKETWTVALEALPEVVVRLVDTTAVEAVVLLVLLVL